MNHLPKIESFDNEYRFSPWACLEYRNEDGSLGHDAFNYYGPTSDDENHAIIVEQHSPITGKSIATFRFKAWKR